MAKSYTMAKSHSNTDSKITSNPGTVSQIEEIPKESYILPERRQKHVEILQIYGDIAETSQMLL